MTNSLYLNNVRVNRAERPILRGFQLEIPAGRAALLRGPNGAGKTTLLKAIAGILPIEDGTIRFSGDATTVEQHDDGMTIGERLHWLGHSNGLKRQLSVRENLEFWCDFLGGDRASVAVAIEQLALAGLEDIPVALLSAGQTRRAGLARLLVAERSLWLLDEPTTALDAASVARVEAIINAHLAGGGVALIATHLPLNIPNADIVELTPLKLDQTALEAWV